MSSKLVLLSVLRSTLSTLSETSNGVHPPLAVYSSALSALEARLESHSQFLHKSSSVIQSRYRGIKTRSTLKSQNDAAKILQSRHRTSLAKSRVSAIKSERQTEQLNDGARKIQKSFRGKKGRESFKETRLKVDQENAAVKIQAVHRGRNGRKSILQTSPPVEELEEDIELLNQSAVKIQSRIRSKSVQLSNTRRTSAVLKLQSAERGRSARSSHLKTKAEYTSARLLQSRVRGASGRREARQKQRMLALKPLDSTLKIGDIVEARLKGSRIYCEGIIIGRSGSGSGSAILDEWDVDFGDGDIQEHVPIGNIRKKINWDDMEIGDHVKVPLPGFKRLMGDAVIESCDWVNGSLSYTVKFDDGEILSSVSPESIVKSASKRTLAIIRWKKGGNLIKAAAAFGDKKWGTYRRMSVTETSPRGKRRGSKELLKQVAREQGKDLVMKNKEGGLGGVVFGEIPSQMKV
ncbi:hypothetical protein TrVE_jg4101 [Triparma verrucosa]|uniref:Uncharacterized protein n=1 Tax=Triparma verrucosa TaxID=1606542 RepID=A0A9W7C4S9_9STRA|nr:hypothetical protein TrVE_jg4101 [Triparma verrucosa]